MPMIPTPNPPAQADPTTMPQLPYNGLITAYNVMQYISIVFLGILALTTTDGLQTQIVYALLAIAGVNAIGSAAYGLAHVNANASIQRAIVARESPPAPAEPSSSKDAAA